MATVLITGNTYPHRNALRNMGGRWNAQAKGWEVPEDRATEAQALVGTFGKNAKRHAYQAHLSYGSDGKEYYRNKRGRCEDAPCCGCCNY